MPSFRILYKVSNVQTSSNQTGVYAQGRDTTESKTTMVKEYISNIENNTEWTEFSHTIKMSDLNSGTVGFNPVRFVFRSGGDFRGGEAIYFDDASVKVTGTAVPEPSAFILCGLAAAAVLFRRRR